MPRALALAAFLAAATLNSHAVAGTHWSCALSEDAVRLVCIAGAERVADEGPSPAASAVVNGTAFPLDPGRRYVVELWSPPTDMEFVDRLARATICYRSPGCSVSVTPWRVGRLHAGR
ncbi:MAG: hypothetical protein AB7F93_10050 [Immundisolibacter sp.]|uniref:hypothetical protein n=1 Tax=Immundisolibacter sp. TaxID=1934948 RepID=UPI003D152F88